MVNLKTNKQLLKHFVLFLTFLAISACHAPKQYLTKIEGKKIAIANLTQTDSTIDKFIEPYKQHIDNDLNKVLAISPETFDKNGKWQTSLGNLFADICMQKGNEIFLKRENKTIDFVLFNSGGLRAILPKGNVTLRTAYQIMPFENNLVVVAMQKPQIDELITYFITEKKAHPLAGISFKINKQNLAEDVKINGKPLIENQTYYVGTNDYLANGGDNMSFFKKGSKRYDLDYKLRNILIDYFEQVDTIPVANDVRVIQE